LATRIGVVGGLEGPGFQRLRDQGGEPFFDFKGLNEQLGGESLDRRSVTVKVGSARPLATLGELRR
jgi:hypothetical protein